MAAIAAVVSDVSYKGDGSAMLAVWIGVTEADTLSPVKLPEYGARSVSIQGTFGGATVVVNGSIDGTNYTGLTNPAGVAISKTSAAVVGVFESVVYYQPVASGGSSQILAVSMLFVGPRRYPN